MSRIQALFGVKKERVLNVYCTAGYPELNSTMDVILSLERSGADLIELGMPYSDPLADGPIIQASSSQALQNGMSIEVLFDQLKALRSKTQIPLILMGYMNPVIQYGFQKFCDDAAAVGVDGLILPDLPEYEYETIYGDMIRKAGLDFIFLVTPETSFERIQKLDQLSSGFLYAVSSSATTGNEKDFDQVTVYLQRLQAMQLRNPVLVGFGIKDKATFDAACQYANGAIIGSAYIKALAQPGDIQSLTTEFLKQVL
ncbi:tryptophan synthase subunit alpha [Sediminibacterium sp. KACHI17]|jgi:tryptophan synthase alpha chain|uniref:Tryptophan synthase alpha chain n=1 Tax=Sediminibacterium sp. KACHI17 TaxID=1751071 RepID=A0AAT9GFG5_9BACT